MANEHRIDEALQRVEAGILPGISMMLDTLIDAAALARPGVDAESYAAEIRTLTLQVEELVRQVEAAAAVPLQGSTRAAA
jgi:hypothetical protein